MKSRKTPVLVALVLCGFLCLLIFNARNLRSDGDAMTNAATKSAPAIPALTGPEVVKPENADLFDELADLERNGTIELPLTDGSKGGRINYVRTHETGASVAGGDLLDGSGTFEIAKEPWGYRGFVLQRSERIAYVYDTDPDGRLTVARRPLDEVICLPDENWKTFAKSDPEEFERIPIFNDGRSVGLRSEAIPLLSSRPEAKATIYLDFDGEVIEGHSWEGGRRIVAPAFNLSADQITTYWREVAEDFIPYQVNVTTDLQTYLRAPQTQRIRCITTSNNFAGAGGVAFNNTFRESGEPVCWNFDPNGGAPDVISHEVGHTFGLHHDDTSTQGYYGGHGSGATSWGPIMGAPYYSAVTQWSKGDYNDANQHQDDIAYLGASAPEVMDDHASTIAGASPLRIANGTSVDQSGVIANRVDVDRFVFTTGGGTVTLIGNNAEGSPNLDIELKLYNSSGTLISTASPSGQLDATLAASLAAGTYTVTVDGVGTGTWASNGYDDYGSIGAYRLTGTIPSPGWHFRIPAYAVNGAALGQVAPGTGSNYSIQSGNTGNAFAINSGTGQLLVANAGALASGSPFTLQVRYLSGGSFRTEPAQVIVSSTPGLKREVWTNLGGSGIGGLTSDAGYPNSPDETSHVPTFQSLRANSENYGQKLSGYLVPPVSGNYLFWTTADDASELWLSTTASPSNKSRIAYNGSNTAPDGWTQQGTQQSAAIPLVAGQRYYIEFLTRENFGGDHASASWQPPGQDRQLIPMENLEYPGTLANQSPWLASQTFRVREDRGTGYSAGFLTGGDFEPGSVLSSYTITGGNTGNAFSLNPTTGELKVNAALSFASRPVYFLTVSATDSGGLSTSAQIAVEIEALAVKREYYAGIGGNPVSNLTSSPNFPDNPTSVTYETHFEAPTDFADNYGQRMSGYLRAPDTGAYTFWIASDDYGELWLSSDSNPSNKTRIAFHTGATGSREWGKYGSQQSAAIQLEGGKFYYIEALQKEGVGGDNLAVAWDGPNFDRVILGAPHVTQQFYNHGAPQLANAAATIYDRETNSSVVTLEALDWSDPGSTVRFSIIGGNADGVFTIDELTGEIRTTTGPLPTGNRTLTVRATDNSTPALSSTATVNVTIAAAKVRREVWTGLAGGQPVTGLTDSFNFPARPDETGYLGRLKAPTSWGDLYGTRLTTYLVPHATGAHTFWIASDDSSELWLSTDMNPSNKRKICQVNGAVGEENWTAQGNQQSATINLVAGQRYYLEVLHKEGQGGDHLAVAWQGPGFGRNVIEGANLVYPDTYRPGLRRQLWTGTPPVTWNEPASFTGTNVGFKAPSNVADNYSQQLSGFLIPAVTGNYVFWIASDDDGSLMISSDENPANATTIASVTGYVDEEAFDVQGSQRSAAIPLVAGQRYYIAARQRDGIGGDHLAIAWRVPGSGREIIPNDFLEHPDTPADRTLPKLERWTGITGDTVAELTGNAAFPASPALTRTLDPLTGLHAPSDNGEDYGQRISAWLVAPETGRYTFWIASDNDSQLWLSSDESPSNKVNIAGVSPFVDALQWDVQSGQKSAPVALEGGKRYYLEILHKEGFGGDHLAVAWQGPGFGRRILENNFLEHPGSIPGRPTLRREMWTGIGGTALSQLANNSRFISGVPNSRGQLTAFETPADITNNYGQRVSALLTAPESGLFKFWISAADASSLSISPDSDPAKRITIAGTTTATGFRAWDTRAEQASGYLYLVAGQSYYLEALHKAGTATDHLSVAWEGPSFERQILDGQFLTYPGDTPVPVALKREVWTGIGGNEVSFLTSDAGYPNSPDLVESLDEFVAPRQWGDNYGQKISGYLIAPSAGDYEFWLASDDDAELWFATNGNPASKTRIAWADGATGYDNWENFASQHSATISLLAGQRCYIEVLQKEGGGDDYASVAWQGPGFDRRPIATPFLEYPGLLPSTSVPGSSPTPTTADPGYLFWLDWHGVTGAGRLADSDDDGDGIPTAIEFVVGGNPGASNSSAILPTLEIEGSQAVYRFRRTAESAASNPVAETSTNLTNWSTVTNGVNNATVTVEPDFHGPGTDRISVRLPVGTSPRFLRLAVSVE